MVYTPETSHGHEASKIASIAVPYLQGKFLDLGCGDCPVWPSAIGVDNFKTFRNTAGIKADIADLSLFADESVDAVFSSHALEDFEKSKVSTVLQEWLRVIKIGGYLVLYVPSANLYPLVGDPQANPAHKWNIYPGDIEYILHTILKTAPGYGLEIVESEERSGTNEYSLFIVVRKNDKDAEWDSNVWQRNPDGKKRALVIRYGAYGDMIQTSSVFWLLKQQGYHLTVNAKPEAYEIIKHDPNVDDWIIQATDFVPNEELGAYWESISERYDRVINMCESIEGALLTLTGRLTHDYPDDVRRNLFGTVNYQTRIHEIAGVSTDPKDFNPRFYPSDQETKKAKALCRAWTGAATPFEKTTPIIAWALTGSAQHKVYPFPHDVIEMLLKRTPCHIALLGDVKEAKMMQDDLILPTLKHLGCEMSRVHPMCGAWSMRESLAFVIQADCVVGPETGLLNAVAHEDNAKVIYLSHSSKKNLTEYWKNTITLEPNRAKSPCYPCHRLHIDWQYCHQSKETKAALCASSIEPHEVFHAIAKSFKQKEVN